MESRTSCLSNPLDWSGWDSLLSLSMREEGESAELSQGLKTPCDWAPPGCKQDKICKAWCAVSKSEAKQMTGHFRYRAPPRCRISTEPVDW